MKIVFITTTLSTGGAEMMLLKLLQHLDRRRFDPYVISLRTKGEVGPLIEALHIPVLALGMNPGLPDPLKVLRLISCLRKIRPNLLQTWMYHADLLGALAALFSGCRRVAWGLRNCNLDELLTKRSTLMVVKACASLSSWLPTRILSCSTRASEVHAAIGYSADKIDVIPNGFDLGRFRPDDGARLALRAELGISPETKLVGLMARYDPQKNHVGFVEAASMIRDEIPDIHFVMAGGGVDDSNATLQGAIRAHGIDKCMHLLGRRDDMPRLMAALDVLASSSFGEAFPNVLGEAMACGVPCVVTDAGDSAEIVGESGRVVETGDMQGLARHIVELLRLPSEAKSVLGQQARLRVKTHYEISHVTRLYESFYERLAKKEFKGDY